MPCVFAAYASLPPSNKMFFFHGSFHGRGYGGGYGRPVGCQGSRGLVCRARDHGGWCASGGSCRDQKMLVHLVGGSKLRNRMGPLRGRQTKWEGGCRAREQCPTGADSMKAYTTSIGVNPTLFEGNAFVWFHGR